MRSVVTMFVLAVASLLAAAVTHVASEDASPPSAQLIATARSAATPPGQGQFQIEDIYVGFGTNPGAASERYRFDFLVFYTNGLMYHGGAAYLLQGPGSLELNDTVRNYHLAKYRLVGDEFHITSSSGTTDVIRRERNRLSVRGALATPWERLPKVDGLRLQGTYLAVTQTADPTWISFTPDGAFKDQGLVKYAANLFFLERGLETPSGGTGTYTIQDYTLTLRYAGGLMTSMFFYVLPNDDVNRPRQFLVNTYFFARQR